MKLRTGLLMLFMFGLTVVPSFAQAVAATPPKPDAVIREFYKWYVHALNQNKEPLTGERPVMRKYVTLRLIREIDRMAKGPDGLDGDYFIDAQDWEIANVSVSAWVTGANTAMGVATFTNFGKPVRVTLELVSTPAGWRISEIKAPSGSLRALFKVK